MITTASQEESVFTRTATGVAAVLLVVFGVGVFLGVRWLLG